MNGYGFQGKVPSSSKTVLNNVVLAQLNNFNYLSCDFTFNYKRKLSKHMWNNLKNTKEKEQNRKRF